jgi:hypothetical protein
MTHDQTVGSLILFDIRTLPQLAFWRALHLMMIGICRLVGEDH